MYFQLRCYLNKLIFKTQLPCCLKVCPMASTLEATFTSASIHRLGKGSHIDGSQSGFFCIFVIYRITWIRFKVPGIFMHSPKSLVWQLVTHTCKIWQNQKSERIPLSPMPGCSIQLLAMISHDAPQKRQQNKPGNQGLYRWKVHHFMIPRMGQNSAPCWPNALKTTLEGQLQPRVIKQLLRKNAHDFH